MTINLDLSKLSEAGLQPRSIANLVRSWEKAGLKCYSLAADQNDIAVLRQMIEPEQTKPTANNVYQLACSFMLGVLLSLISVLVTWFSLMR